MLDSEERQPELPLLEPGVEAVGVMYVETVGLYAGRGERRRLDQSGFALAGAGERDGGQ